jgi:hypothetical protein
MNPFLIQSDLAVADELLKFTSNGTVLEYFGWCELAVNKP